MTERSSGSSRKMQHFMTPSSPPYPPYAYVEQQSQMMYDPNDPSHTPTYAYVYPLSPQFSVQYYSDFIPNTADNTPRYQSYPGSPVLHPHLHHYQLSPQLIPSSPPFSPNLQYQTSPPTHAFVLPPHGQHHFPPLHISSPLLTASPAGYVQPIDLKKRRELLEQEYVHLTQFHPQNIYVRGLPLTETDESFLALCKVYGPIRSSKAIIDQKSGECKGYGFAMFEDQEDCQVAIMNLNAAGYQASLARVGQESFSSRLRSLQDETSTNIYISNLPVTMDEEGLEDLFNPFQTISNRILRDPQSGMSRGVGFARLADRQSASAIIDKYNGHSISGSSAPLQVRFADSPAQKRLKNQTTTTKKTISKRDLFPAGFPNIRSMMPITPETMLGIAPSSNGYPHPIPVTEPSMSDVDVLAAAVDHQLSLKESTLV
ncbi:hypothetical protein INT47_009596 [Mucor saturninus]|uniref:RRM domain-containing protein n=1 Tax=Mucor saturninus TaxID=64648 RepID=A0A8H7UV43_9FUNG|nr:hypothetical protein INT47_009596 [Mucor saturninus]